MCRYVEADQLVGDDVYPDDGEDEAYDCEDVVVGRRARGAGGEAHGDGGEQGEDGDQVPHLQPGDAVI